MSDTDRARKRAVVMPPEDGAFWWQPVPANGYAARHADARPHRLRRHSMGYQTIAPDSRVREHSHDKRSSCRPASAAPAM